MYNYFIACQVMVMCNDIGVIAVSYNIVHIMLLQPPSTPDATVTVSHDATVDSQSSKSTTTPPESVTSVTTPSSSGQNDVIIPSHWCGATQKCITEKKLNVKVRCDIVRTLITLLVAKHGPRPKTCEVEHVARQLILKYPFMRDDIGTGYVSTCLL